VTANIISVRRDGSEYHAVQVGASDRPEKTTTAQMLGHFKRAGVCPKRIVQEFAVTRDAHIPVGLYNSAISNCLKGSYTTQERDYLLYILCQGNLWMSLQIRMFYLSLNKG
jgi:hypothetical protein